MMFLFTVILVLQLSGLSDATILESSTSSLSISPPAILASSSPTCIVYSCFPVNDSELSLGSAKEACCKSVVEVWQADGENDRGALSSIELQERCMLELAQVPPSVSLIMAKNQHDSAQFSWVVSKTSESAVRSASIEQYFWTIPAGGDRFERDLVQTVTPYHKPSVQNSSKSRRFIAPKVDSHLGKDGGMHRLFRHRFRLLENSTGGEEDPVYFLYLTIPQGMFIDLDDPIEIAQGTIQSTPTDGVDASHSFVVTTSKDSSLVQSFRARLHAATVCDIEQPSFVSGQHLLVWEIDGIGKQGMPPLIEFSTKLHLRYPHPSATLEEWIDLPNPLLFATSNLNYSTQEYDWGLGIVERVWVAAGKDEDHDWIMGMTILFCLIGVGIMLRDVSRVSLWDDV